MLPDDTNLIPLLGLEAMSDDEARETLAEIHDVIMQAILFRVLPKLIAGEQEELNRLVESKADGETIFAFLKEHVPDIDNIVEEEARKTRERIAKLAPPFSEVEKKYGADAA